MYFLITQPFGTPMLLDSNVKLMEHNILPTTEIPKKYADHVLFAMLLVDNKYNVIKTIEKFEMVLATESESKEKLSSIWTRLKRMLWK